MNERKSPLFLAAALAGYAALGCASEVPTDHNPCPCAAGNVCCSDNTCAKDQASCTSSTKSPLEEARGHWTGYVENVTFASGSDAIALSFEIKGDGTLGGTVVLGKGPPPAAPTDGSVGWPPGLPSSEYGQAPQRPIEGFAYAAQDIRWEDQRLRFKIALSDPWQGWCGLQQSYEWGAETFGCIPNLGYSTGDSCTLGFGPTAMPIDCGKLALCNHGSVCACTATSCVAEGSRLSIDIALRNGKGDGSVDLDGNHNLRVTRGN